MKTKLEFLKELRLFINEDTWTQKAYARNAQGNSTGITNSDACRWCLEGAFYHLHYKQSREYRAHLIDTNQNVFNDLIDAVQDIYGFKYNSLVFVNDSEGIDAVHKVIDKAIELENRRCGS